MIRFAVVASMVVGCYNPAPSPGGPCSDQGACPAGLRCVDDRCVSEVPDADLDGPAPGDGPAADALVADGPTPIDAPIDAMVSPTWLTPTPIGGVNTGGVSETDPSLTADRLTIVFSRANDLYLGRRSTTTSSFTVSALANLNTSADEKSPELSADGLTLYFASDRLVINDQDVYVSTYNGSAWSDPVLVPELSGGGNQDDLAISPDGLTAIVATSNVFYRSTRATTSSAWSTPVLLSGMFPPSAAAPSIDGVGDIYFHAGTIRDLYVARRSGSTYLAPVAIGELNTAARDAAPNVAANALFLWFERSGDLYESRR